MAHIKIRIPGYYSIYFGSSLAHWRPNGTHHGPKSNPRIIHISWLKLRTTAAQRGTPGLDNTGRRIWIYIRGGYAWHADILILRGDTTKNKII
jgi:hypothetical protein